MTVTPTIVDRLVERAARAPSDVLLTLVDEDGQDEGWLTAAGLHEAARRVAAHLLGPAGLQPGDRVHARLPAVAGVRHRAGRLPDGGRGRRPDSAARSDPARRRSRALRHARAQRGGAARADPQRLPSCTHARTPAQPRLQAGHRLAGAELARDRRAQGAARGGRAAAHAARRSGDPPVHLRIDRDAARRDDHARQPHPPARLQRRRTRLPHRRARRHLAPPLPRLRPDQRHPQLAAWQRQPVDALAARLHPAPGGLVRGDEPRRRHAHRGAELRLRALDEEDHAGAAARLGPLAARGDDERRRADPAGRRPRLPRRVRAEQAAPLGLLPRLRPRRAHGGRVGAWPGDGEGVAAGARARGRCARAGGRRGGEDAAGLRPALARA